MTLTPLQLSEVIEGYVDCVIDNMSVKDMEQLLCDLLTESLEDQPEDDVKELICSVYGEEFYQELVDSATSEA